MDKTWVSRKRSSGTWTRAASGFVLVLSALPPIGPSPAHGEGSVHLVASGGASAVTEWRTSQYANALRRRTFLKVYANSGAKILMGSSAANVGSGPVGQGRMRGHDEGQSAMFSYISPAESVPKAHPLRPIRAMVNDALKQLSPQFDELYAKSGRPSIAPERLLRALLLQILYTVRSERMLIEQLDYNLLFRWFVGLSMDDAVWDATVFTKNRDRLLAGDVAQAFFDRVLDRARYRGLLSNEHFTVDGTLIKAWAGHKSFRTKDEPRNGSSDGDRSNPTVDFRGEKRSNDTHQSTTDPDARLAGRRGKESALSYQAHVLMENRNGLVVRARLTHASGTAERDTAVEMVANLTGNHRVTVAGDKGYDTQEFVECLRELNATPHVARNTTGRSSAIDGRTVRHEGYAISQRCRKRVEEIFGWMKTIGPMRQTRFRGTRRVDWMFVLSATAYDLVRMRNLAVAT